MLKIKCFTAEAVKFKKARVQAKKKMSGTIIFKSKASIFFPIKSVKINYKIKRHIESLKYLCTYLGVHST